MKTTITKRDIAKRVAREVDEKFPLAEKVVSALFTILREVMAEADPEVRIEIRDFGVFEVKTTPKSRISILLLTNTTISVVVLIGVIMLAGIVVNNAIVLIDYINNLRRTKGLAKMDAIKEACEIRLRPILMTTTTTILALLPMAIGFGEGAELRAPMAIAVIGGLAISTMLTLILIPTVYSLVQFKESPIVEV